ncbi:MAG: hypothetical protein KDE27_16790 [Planctomycetes bacterium]|nr:hypothetical protein [Planctomycetota bacterium]
MKLAVYAHPFDLDALAGEGGLRRLADLGFAEIALATSYHDGRWLQPWHPQTRVRFLEDGTVHFRPRADYGVLQPLPSTAVPATGPSPLERLCGAAPAAGLTVRAWNVFHHNTRLGDSHPELAVENAFGDRHTYALCPAQPEVQRYALALAADLAAHDGLAAIELEAVGWMGWKHSSHHDKASFQPKGALLAALSYCFCAACRERIAATGGDPERARARACELVTAELERGDAMAPGPVLEGTGGLDEVATARAATMHAFGADLRRAVATDLALQVHPDPTFAGSQLPVAQVDGFGAQEFVVTAYGESLAATARLVAAAPIAALGPKRLSIWPKAPQLASDEDLVKVRELCAQHGIDALAIYHLGLLPWRTIERAARVLQA